MRQRRQRRDKIARLISWGHWFTFFNILLALAIGTLYIEAAATPSTFLGGIYMVLSWLGHFAFLPFIVFILLVFPFCLIIPYSKVLRGIATLVASFGLIALVADALFFRQYGYHLNTYSLSQLAVDAEAAFAGASFVLLLSMLLVFVVLLVFELALANIAWKRLDRLRARHWGASFSAVFVLCFFTSHSLHIWADAVFYTPITAQDDLFPVSYPTTARTLMSKQGWLVEERIQATDRLLRETNAIQLNYPTRELMCARQPEQRNTLVVVFNHLTLAQQQLLEQELPQLQEYGSTVLGQTSTQAGLFELIYGLADIYAPPVYAAQKQPAYWQQLTDYQVKFEIQGDAAAFALPDFLNPSEASGYRTRIDVVLSTAVDTALLERVQLALADGHHVVITGLTPNQAVNHDAEPYAMSRLQVPLYHSPSLTLQPQDVVILTDLMPTLVNGYINCSEGVRAYATGRDISTTGAREFPVMTSFGRDLVIYDREVTSIINGNGSMRSFDNETFETRPNVSPATPVLVDGLRHLQRFSAKSDE
ncbi:DUF3413 domain-containing protein [Pseudidiomarina terrestris]|uniref:DUF3413 domain-containing protein n=1 Tax=Pseudidiomarina terrestris TaxID=2820060 RepID=UPI0026531A9D|nr:MULTISPECIES: DUF3413 domain-containing protein [unclassified Pseudidiomarina]MDN7135215.1 DUF3413 domain-containing protein [Pseudidiomarina sp. 1ASP75-5]MEA3587005.1 DUF3413 domain-containing protein [Pseudidiomarina sp. 1APP75-27a]